MTSAALEALERLCADVAAHEASAPVTRAWASPPPPLAAVTVDPWDDDAIGGADVRFAAGRGPTLAALAARFGPLAELPRLPSGTLVLRAEWWREAHAGARDPARPRPAGRRRAAVRAAGPARALGAGG